VSLYLVNVQKWKKINRFQMSMFKCQSKFSSMKINNAHMHRHNAYLILYLLLWIIFKIVFILFAYIGYTLTL
jgi:uncharacterized membrane protein